MLLTPRCTPGQASQIPLAIRKLVWGSINPLTAVIHGRSLPQILVFLLARVWIAMQFSGYRPEHLVFNRLPPIAALLSMAVPSLLSSSIRVTRILSTFHPTGASAASAPLRAVPPALLPAFHLTDYGSPPTAEQTSRS